VTVSSNDDMSGSTGPSPAASNALKPACVSSTCARCGISVARTACRNSAMSLSSLPPVLSGSVTGPPSFTIAAPGMGYRPPRAATTDGSSGRVARRAPEDPHRERAEPREVGRQVGIGVGHDVPIGRGGMKHVGGTGDDRAPLRDWSGDVSRSNAGPTDGASRRTSQFQHRHAAIAAGRTPVAA
jgi:hypothetical protein